MTQPHKTFWRWAFFVALACLPAFAQQNVQFLPEIDTYLRLNSMFQVYVARPTFRCCRQNTVRIALDRRDGLHGRNLNAVGGDDMRGRDGRAGDAGPAERRLQDGLLLQRARLGHQQRLLAGGDLGLGANHLDLRQRAHFHLLAIVFQQPVARQPARPAPPARTR